MNYAVLKLELDTDPLGRGYAGMTDAEVAADLNTEYRTRNRVLMSGSEVANAISQLEFNAKTAEQQQRIWDILHLGELNPFGIEAGLFLQIFGAESVTIVNLQALRVEPISRAEELGLGVVKAGYVERVRT